MALQKKDFIEIEFTGRIKGGDIFDSNIKEDLQKINSKEIAKPFTFCLGEGMFLKGIEDYLLNKELGEYIIELTPENAFGPRMPQLIQTVPSKIFTSQRLNPIPGAVFNLDGRIAKVLSFSGGRVMIDLNNPLAGKTVIYNVKVLRKVEDIQEKTKSLINFLFRKDFVFSIKEKKLVIESEKEFSKIIEMFKDKFKDILDLDLEIKEAPENTPKKAQ